mgnify:FL=1
MQAFEGVPKEKGGQPKPTANVKELFCFAVLPGHSAHAAVDHDRACQPFSAVATHAKVSPFFAAVMRLYCVPFPVRMLIVPLTQEIMTCLPAGFIPSGMAVPGFTSSGCSVSGAVSALWNDSRNDTISGYRFAIQLSFYIGCIWVQNGCGWVQKKLGGCSTELSFPIKCTHENGQMSGCKIPTCGQ